MLVALLGAGLAQAQNDEMFVRVTAMDEGARVLLGDFPAALGRRQPIFEDEPLAFQVERGAVLYVGLTRTILVARGVSGELVRRGDGGLAITLKPMGDADGWLDVYHDAESPRVYISVAGAAVGLPRGLLRIRPHASGGVQIAVAAGRASVSADGPDEGVVLSAEADNSLVVGSDGTLSTPQRVDGLEVLMVSARSAVVERSLLPEMVRVAERVAEGDIEPPTRGARIAAVAVAPEVRIPELVPRGSIAAQVIAGAQSIAQVSPPSTAEAFLGSGSAALAVVGARLERTRIIGTTSGAAGSAPLSINRNLRRPFTLTRQ